MPARIEARILPEPLFSAALPGAGAAGAAARAGRGAAPRDGWDTAVGGASLRTMRLAEQAAQAVTPEGAAAAIRPMAGPAPASKIATGEA